MIHLPNPAHHLVLYSRKTKNSFCISTWLGGKIQRNYFMTSKTKFQISMFTKKVLLKHRYTHSIHIYLCLLLHYNDRVDWLQQRPYGLQNLKYLLSGPSQKRLPTCTQWYAFRLSASWDPHVRHAHYRLSFIQAPPTPKNPIPFLPLFPILTIISSLCGSS